MTAIQSILNAGNVIMLFAKADEIARERAAIRRELDEQWHVEIPRRCALVKALMADDGDTLAKAAADELLADAEPLDLAEARKIVADLEREHGIAAAVVAGAQELLQKLAALQHYNERRAELDRLERRSVDLRFAAQPAPAPHHTGHHH